MDPKTKNNILILVNKKGDVSKIKHILKKYEGKRIVIVGFGSAVQDKLQSRNISYKTTEDYVTEETYKNLGEEGIPWVKKWSGIKIGNRGNFKEIVNYEDTSLWWFVEEEFMSFFINEIMKNIILLKSIINTENPSRVILFDDRSVLMELARGVAIEKGIKVSNLRSKISFGEHFKIENFLSPLVLQFILLVHKVVRGSACKFLSFIYKRNKDITLKGEKILFVSYISAWRPTTDTDTGKRIKNDNILGPVIKEVAEKKGYQILCIDHIGAHSPFYRKNLRVLKEKIAFYRNITYRPLEYYLNNDIRKKIRDFGKNLGNTWRELENDPNFQNSFKSDNISFWHIIKLLLRKFFALSFLLFIYDIEVMKRIISTEKPDLIVLTGEAHPYGKAFIAAAKMENVPTIGIAHANIVQHHLSYQYSKTEICEDSSPKCCLIPDITAVCGDYSKDLLMQYGNYPEDKIAVTGQPRYDILHKADEIFSKKKIVEQLNISQDKGLVVLTTQTNGAMFTHEENVSLLEGVYSAMRDFSDKKLVVKLHPEEKPGIHENVAKNLDISDIIIIKDIDILELLYACDLMMTVSSTTAFDALILNKPVITINLTNRPDTLPCAEKGAALGVYKKGDIKRAIHDALYNEETRKKLAENRKKFVYEHCYKIDGKATERVVKHFEEMANK